MASTFFYEIADALEEASWCANEEKRKYVVRARKNDFQVFPKYRKGKKKYRHIEVGFQRTSHET